MITTTGFTAPGNIDEALQRLRSAFSMKQHDGLAGGTSRHGGIWAIPGYPDGVRPFPSSALDIVFGFRFFGSQALPPASHHTDIGARPAPWQGAGPSRWPECTPVIGSFSANLRVLLFVTLAVWNRNFRASLVVSLQLPERDKAAALVLSARRVMAAGRCIVLAKPTRLKIDLSRAERTRYWLSESDLAYLLERSATDGIQKLKAEHVANAACKS